MLPKRINYLLTYFDVCGFNSGWSKLSSSRKAIHRTNITHILMAVFFTLFKIHMILGFSTVRLVKAINFMLQYSAALYTYWCIIIDSHLQMQKHRHFWQTVQRIDKFYCPQNKFTIKYYLLKFGLCFFTSALAILVIILAGNLSQSEVVIMYIFLIKICEARVFYYIFCVEVLRFQLKQLKDALKNHPYHLRRIRWIRQYYDRVYEMSNFLIGVFGLSQVAAVLFCFVFFMADLNWIYINIYMLNGTVKDGIRITSKAF